MCHSAKKMIKFDHALYTKLLQDENDNIVLNDIPFPLDNPIFYHQRK